MIWTTRSAPSSLLLSLTRDVEREAVLARSDGVVSSPGQVSDATLANYAN